MEQEILSIINNIMKKCAVIQDGAYSQNVKDEAIRMVNESFDAMEEVSDVKLNQLVYKELKKRKISELK